LRVKKNKEKAGLKNRETKLLRFFQIMNELDD